MKIEFFAHDVLHVYIILDAAPGEPECDVNEYGECEQWANERKELEHTANGSDGQCIRQAHDQQKRAVSNESKK